MTIENFKKADELKHQIEAIKRKIDSIRNILNDEHYEVEIVVRYSDEYMFDCEEEKIFKGDEARDMLRKHLVDFTVKHEQMLTEFERL